MSRSTPPYSGIMDRLFDIPLTEDFLNNVLWTSEEEEIDLMEWRTQIRFDQETHRGIFA